MNIIEAAKALQIGYKIRRPTWEDDFIYENEIGQICVKSGKIFTHLSSTESLLFNEWEIYREKHFTQQSK